MEKKYKKEFKNIKITKEVHSYVLENIDIRRIKLGVFAEDALCEKIERELKINKPNKK